MARCTAPVYGHRTASGAAACPACGGGYRSYSSYPSYNYSSSRSTSDESRSVSSGAHRTSKARWSPAGSTILYTPEELRDVIPLLGSRSGLNTAEESMEKLTAKIAELVRV